MTKNAKILLLDDDARVRFNLKLFLEDEGFECHECDSAEQAFKTIEKYFFNIAIVDIRLPGKTGEEFILEASQKAKDMKFIIYTGSADYRLPTEILGLGITTEDVLHKPVANMNVFVEIISHKLNGK